MRSSGERDKLEAGSVHTIAKTLTCEVPVFSRKKWREKDSVPRTGPEEMDWSLLWQADTVCHGCRNAKQGQNHKQIITRSGMQGRSKDGESPGTKRRGERKRTVEGSANKGNFFSKKKQDGDRICQPSRRRSGFLNTKVDVSFSFNFREGDIKSQLHYGHVCRMEGKKMWLFPTPHKSHSLPLHERQPSS